MRKHILAMALPVLLLAQAPRGGREPLPNEQWVSLFNGKDLTGWVQVGKEKWTVEDGAIHGQGVTKEYGYLMTEKDYKDFWMSLRFKCEADGNSGVFSKRAASVNLPGNGSGLRANTCASPVSTSCA